MTTSEEAVSREGRLKRWWNKLWEPGPTLEDRLVAWRRQQEARPIVRHLADDHGKSVRLILEDIELDRWHAAVHSADAAHARLSSEASDTREEER